MNGIDFYNIVRKHFNGENQVAVGTYINPLMNWPQHFPTVQFTDPDDITLPPLNSLALERVIADPLAGPFYETDVVGWWGSENLLLENKGVYSVGITILGPERERLSSCPIVIVKMADDVLEVLKEACGETPYLVEDYLNIPRTGLANELVQESRDIISSS